MLLLKLRHLRAEGAQISLIRGGRTFWALMSADPCTWRRIGDPTSRGWPKRSASSPEGPGFNYCRPYRASVASVQARVKFDATACRTKIHSHCNRVTAVPAPARISSARKPAEARGLTQKKRAPAVRSRGSPLIGCFLPLGRSFVSGFFGRFPVPQVCRKRNAAK